MLKVSGSKLFQNFRVDLADFVGSCVVTFWYKAVATLCDESLYWRTRRCFVSLQVSLEKLFERQVWKKWWQRTSEAVKHWLSAVFNQTLQQMLIGVLFSRWIFWARSGASIKYGTITAFSQKQIHLSHQTTHLYNFFTQKTFLTLINMPTSGYINFYVITFVTNLYNQETDSSRLQFIAEWSYCLFTEGLCCPLLAAKMMTKPSIYRSYNNLPLCYPYVSTYQHSLGQSYSLWCDFPTLLQRQTSSAMKSSVVLYL